MSGETHLSRSDMIGKKLIFFPSSEEEATALQQKLIDMGIPWSHGPKSVTNIENTMQFGLVVMDDKLYYANGDKNGDKSGYTSTSTRRILGEFISPEKKFLIEQFEKINKRLDALERRVDEIHEAVYPKFDKKPVLKPPST